MPASIEDYVHAIFSLVARSPVVQSSDIAVDRRTPWTGLIRGRLVLLDGSELHFRELVDTQAVISKVMYTYHYQTADGILIFRYDDTPHHRQVATFPHHKHDGDERRIVAAPPPALDTVLHEVVALRDWNNLRQSGAAPGN